MIQGNQYFIYKVTKQNVIMWLIYFYIFNKRDKTETILLLTMFFALFFNLLITSSCFDQF